MRKPLWCVCRPDTLRNWLLTASLISSGYLVTGSPKPEKLLWSTVRASNNWGILAMLVLNYSLQDNCFQNLVLISLAAPAGGAAGKRSWTFVHELVFTSRHPVAGEVSLRLQDPQSGATEVPGKTAARKPGTDPATA